MRVLVIGGTRFIGLAAVRELSGRGHEVTVFHRGRTTAQLPPNVTELIGDRRTISEFTEQLLGCRPDVILDMIAITESDADSAIQAFRNRVAKYVVASSIDVYLSYGRAICTEPGEPPRPPADESSPLRSKLYPYRGPTTRADDDPSRVLDDYDKIPIERKLLAERSFDTTVLRLPMVYGPGDYQRRMFPYLRRIADNRPHIVLGESHSAWMTARGYVDDIAQGIAIAVESDASRNEVFNVCESEALSELEWVRRISEAAEYRGEIVVVPDSLLPRDDKFDPRSHLSADSSKIRRLLGYGEVVNDRERIRRTVEWELRNFPTEYDESQFDYVSEDAAVAGLR